MKLYAKCAPTRALELLANATAPLRSSDIAEALSIQPGRAVDILTALHAGGRVARTGTRRGYKYAIAKTQPGESTNEPEPEPEPVSPVRSED